VSRKSVRRAVATQLIAQREFLAHLKGQLHLFDWVEAVLGCQVTLVYLFIAYYNNLSNKKHVFSRYLIDLCRNRSRYWNNFNGRYYKIRYGLSNNTKMSPQLHPFLSFGGRKREKRETLDCPLSIAAKLFRSTTSSGKVVRLNVKNSIVNTYFNIECAHFTTI